MKKILRFKKNFLFFTAITVVFATSFFFYLNSNYAQGTISSQGIEISPPTQEFDVDPGLEKTFEVKVRNRGSNTFTMKPRIEDFTASGEEGQVALTNDSPYSISSWSTVSPELFTLKPNESKKVTINVKIPQRNVGGGLYGAVVFAVTAENQKNTATVAQEIASLFLLRVSGPIEEKLSILSLTAPQFTEFAPVPLKIRLFNGGNIHTKTAGIVTINNVLGKKVTDIVIPPTNIFPQSTRTIETSFDSDFVVGPYSAQAILFYGTNNESITAFTPFFVFPVRLVAFIVVAIFLFLFVNKYVRKRKVAKQKPA